MKPQQAFAFDRFVLDPLAGALYDRSGAVRLTPKAYALLELLLANAGRLVTKRELLDTLWARAIVTDGVIKVCVREIRRALGDDAQVPHFIETAHRRGYRFIAAVATVPPVYQPAPALHAAAGIATWFEPTSLVLSRIPHFALTIRS